MIGTVNGWAVTFGTVDGPGWVVAPPPSTLHLMWQHQCHCTEEAQMW